MPSSTVGIAEESDIRDFIDPGLSAPFNTIDLRSYRSIAERPTRETREQIRELFRMIDLNCGGKKTNEDLILKTLTGHFGAEQAESMLSFIDTLLRFRGVVRTMRKKIQMAGSFDWRSKVPMDLALLMEYNEQEDVEALAKGADHFRARLVEQLIQLDAPQHLLSPPFIDPTSESSAKPVLDWVADVEQWIPSLSQKIYSL
jgi:hypothetical protein